MSSFPCPVRFVSGSGQVRYRLGDGLVDRYLEFVAGSCRPNTLRAVAVEHQGEELGARGRPVAVAIRHPTAFHSAPVKAVRIRGSVSVSSWAR